MLPTRRVPFPIDKFSRYCLMNGIDQLGFLLDQEVSDQARTSGERMKKIVVLGGDGVGPEVTADAVRVLEAVSAQFKLASSSRTR